MARAFAKAFYNSLLWQEVRSSVLKRDRYMCQHCRMAPATEVHHKARLTPDNINDPRISVNPDNLISLCEQCHKQMHRRDRREGRAERTLGRRIIFDANGMPQEAPPGVREK